MILNDIQGCQIKRVRIGTGIASTLETTDVITDALTNDVYEANWDTHHHGTSQIICWYEGKNKSLTISTDTPSKSFIIFQAKAGSQNLYEAMYLYGMWVNYSTTNNIDVKDGTQWLEFSKNKTFQGRNYQPAPTAI